jgi:hypothetical protein
MPANSTTRNDAVRNDVGRSPASDNGGWRRFSDSSNASRGGAAMSRSGDASSSAGSVSRVPRPENSVRQGSSGNDGNWRQFTPQSRGTMENSNGVSRGSEGPRGGYQGSVRQDSPRGYSRPPLEMRQPIVTPRSSEGNAGYSRGPSPSRGGGGYSNGSGGGNGGGHSQPSGGGGGNHGGSSGGGSPRSGGSGHRY